MTFAKEKHYTNKNTSFKADGFVAGELGFEPRMALLERAVIAVSLFP